MTWKNKTQQSSVCTEKQEGANRLNCFETTFLDEFIIYL